jgi:glycosyltransferase involved in cell wall biosynthesis
MAQFPHSLFSPATLLTVIGLSRRVQSARSRPVREWRSATVDLVILARNDQDNIVRCLASVLRQTLRPRQIFLVDDGSVDHTTDRALAFCTFHGVDLLITRRFGAIGKTRTLDEQASTLDGDVLFVLDAGAVLESDNYVERTVRELFQGVGIASASGRVRMLRDKDCRALDESRDIRGFLETSPAHLGAKRPRLWHRLTRRVANLPLELWLSLRRFFFIRRVIPGTVSDSGACAVAYRRRYLQAVFEDTKARAISIERAMVKEGYRAVQLVDVSARTAR